MKNTGRIKDRAQLRIRLLKETIKQNREKLINMSETSVNELLNKHENISNKEQLAIREILKAAKKESPKRHRYSDEWIVLCILLHMRSPVTYRMMYENKILPLPNSRTIRR